MSKDDITVVTGGASGIGAACCQLLAARGGKVVVLARRRRGGPGFAEALGGLAARRCPRCRPRSRPGVRHSRRPSARCRGSVPRAGTPAAPGSRPPPCPWPALPPSSRSRPARPLFSPARSLRGPLLGRGGRARSSISLRWRACARCRCLPLAADRRRACAARPASPPPGGRRALASPAVSPGFLPLPPAAGQPCAGRRLFPSRRRRRPLGRLNNSRCPRAGVAFLLLGGPPRRFPKREQTHP